MDAAHTSQSRRRTTPEGIRVGASHDPYQPLFELAGVGLAQIDPVTHRFTRVNRRLCLITGYAETELLARTPIDITLPDDWHADRPAFQGLLAGNFSEHTVEKRYVRKDGSIAWVMVTLNAIREASGALRHLVSVVREIDKRKRAESDLQKRNRALTFLSDTATRLLMADRPEELIPSLVAGLANHLDVEIYAGHAYDPADERLHLLTSSEALEPLRDRIGVMHLGQHTSGTVALRREPIVLEDALASDDPTATLVRSLGITAWVCYPLLASGRLAGTLALGTRRRPAFEPGDLELIRATCDQLAMALERRRLTHELERRARDLSQSNRAKDNFLAILSHELRTPLTPVLLSASELASDPSLPRPARDEMAAIRQNVELEARLIDDLLDLTRIARGKLQLDFKAVDAHDLIAQALRTVSPDARAKSITIDSDLLAKQAVVEGDPARLQQILWNLLKNAIKFTPEGGTIAVRTSNKQPRPKSKSQNGHPAHFSPTRRLVIEVQDSGIGIPADMLPKIFEAFEQGTPSITRRFGGLGLGLAISRALASAHSGSLSAASPGQNQGSTFTLSLPLTLSPHLPPSPTPTSPLPHSPLPHATSLRILLVEDHASTASTLARLLRKMGHRVAVAGGVAAALDLVAASPFDLLISDIGLPDGSGLDLMRRIREIRPITGVALSGYGTEADIQQSLAAGFSQHLTKPISIDQLKSLTGRRAE